MRICLVRCPSPFLIEDKAFPPLGLIAVGTGLKLRGYEVHIHDGPLDEIPTGYTHYGFGPTTPEYPAAKQAQKRIWAETPGAKCVLGGPHVTLNYPGCKNDGWDGVLLGDGEIEAEKAFWGGVITAQDRPLDEYPIPDRSLIDLGKYDYKLEGRPATTLTTSKGCPFHCAFCSKNHARVRMRSAVKVLEEIEYLHDGFGYNALVFPEDIFILDRRRTEIVCSELKALRMIWRCFVRADMLVRYGQAFVQMLREAGCVAVGMGIESGSDTILSAVRKGETTATMREAVAMLKGAGIKVKGFFVVGLPGESPDTLAETERFLADAQLDDIDCAVYQPYPGSPITANPEQYDIQWSGEALGHYKGRPGEYRGVVRTSALTAEEIVAARDRLESQYKRVAA